MILDRLTDGLRRGLPALIASIPVTLVSLAVLGIVLTAAGPTGLGLTTDQTSSWIAVLYGFPMLITLALTVWYRQPMFITGNIFAIIFFVSLGHQVSYPELAGASLLAGAIVLAGSAFDIARRTAAWIPAPIVNGVIAGAVTPFMVNVFTFLSTSRDGVRLPAEVPLMVGGALAAYVISQRALRARIPPILAAFVTGLVLAALTGQLGDFPSTFSLPRLALIQPAFSASAIAAVTPVLVALLTVQSNIPSIVYMRSQGFDPPERALHVVSGAGTVIGSFIGPIAVSLAIAPVLLTAGPSAGPPSLRYRSVFLPVAIGLVIALFAATAADLAVLVPSALLLGIAGLALLGALVNALRETMRGPLVLGPIFAFAIALSDMTVFGLGPFFWSLVLGIGTSMLLERDGWRRFQAEAKGEATRS